MTNRLHSALLLVFPLFFAWTGCASSKVPPRAQKAVLNLSAWNFEQDGPVALRGQWEFHWKQLYTPENFPRGGATKPHLIPVPSSWNGYKWNGRALPSRGYATMRLRVRLPAGKGLAIKVQNAASSYRLFVNGRLVAKNGVVARSAEKYRPQYRPLVVEIPDVRGPGDVEFIAQIANYSHRRGGMWGTIRIGPTEQIRMEHERSLAMDILLAGTLLIIGLYHIAFHALRRRSRDALYFALFCLTISLRALVLGERFLIQNFPEFPFPLLLTLEYLTFFLGAMFFGMYFQAAFPREFSRTLLRVLQAIALGFSAVVLFTPLSIYSYLAPVFQIVTLLFGLCIFYSAILAVRRRRPGAGLYLGGMTVFLGTLTVDILFFNFLLPTGGESTPFGTIVFVFAQAILLARRYSGAFAQVESLSGELEARNQELMRMDKLKDAFLANTSHELRTPLQGIIGMAEAMRHDENQELSPASQKRLGLITAGGRRLAHLVGDILDFSKLRHKDVQLSPASISLHPLVQLQIEVLAYNLPADGQVALFNDVPEDLAPVYADEARLTQILQNLLGNAVRFTRQGEIRVGAQTIADHMIEIRVSDTGSGIPPEDRERIFEPFEQASHVTDGTGLGLPIARSLVELQGGRLRIGDDVGSGTVLYFTLPAGDSGREEPPPLKQVHDDLVAGRAAAIVGERASVGTLAEPGAAPDESRPQAPVALDAPRVLVVDDEPLNLEVMRSFLESMGARIELVSDAEVARNVLERNPLPDCLVLDIMMPGISGLELARELRVVHDRNELPILMVTARVRTMDLMAAIDAGVNDYLIKPFERREFLLRVSNLVEVSRAHRDREHSRTALRDAVRVERANINADMHDHLGAALTDLKFFIGAARENAELQDDFGGRLEDMVDRAARILREDLLGMEDLTLLEDDFPDGMHLIILRRYVDAGREIQFRAPDENHQELNERLDNRLVAVLYAVIKEMVTNDLKYGVGDSSWKLTWDAEELRVEFSALSHYHLAGHGTGKGTAGMIRRLAEVGGHLRMSIQEDREQSGEPRLIEALISVPL